MTDKMRCPLRVRYRKNRLFNLSFAVYAVFFFLSSAVWYTHSGTLSYSTLYRADMPTWRGEPFMTVADNASDPQQYQAPLIHNHTTFKCYITFSNIIMSCDMPPCILFTIHLFFNAWCQELITPRNSHVAGAQVSTCSKFTADKLDSYSKIVFVLYQIWCKIYFCNWPLLKIQELSQQFWRNQI